MTTPAGWYPDPTQPTYQRYWDGQNWTPHTNAPAAGAGMHGFGRSQEDVAKDVAAVWVKHSKVDPLAARSRCTGGAMRCGFPMDAEAFTEHQARAVVDEVFMPELGSFVQQADLATQTLDSVAELRQSSVKNQPLWMRMLGPALLPRTPRNAKVGLQWQTYSSGGWLALLVIVAVFVFIFLKS
jgi:hypothetical protein